MSKQNKASKIRKLMDKFPTWSAAEIADKVGCSAAYVWKLRKDWIDAFDLTSDMEVSPVSYTHHETTDKEPDMVNHPPHYTDGGIEAIEYIAAKLSEEEFIGYIKGNVLKYVSRAGKKGDLFEDFAKARFYIDLIAA